jgi:hypothetical protein
MRNYDIICLRHSEIAIHNLHRPRPCVTLLVWRVKLLSHLPACGALIPTKPHFEGRHQTGRDKAESLYFCILRETGSLHTVMRALRSSSRNRAALGSDMHLQSHSRVYSSLSLIRKVQNFKTRFVCLFSSESNLYRNKFHIVLQHSLGGLDGSSVSQNYTLGPRYNVR